MGTGTGGYVRIRLETYYSKFDEPANGQLHRISELAFDRAPSPQDRQPPTFPVSPGPPPPDPPSLPAVKVGLGGVDPADVITFNLYAATDDGSWVGMGTKKQRRIKDELEDVFGGTWTGFAVAAAPTGTRFRLAADLVINPRWKKKAKRPFQIIPIVLAFGTDRFEDHYLLTLSVAQQTEERVDTSVTQPYQ